MNWEERIKLAGAPGPPIAESRSRTLLPQERVTESSLAGPALKSDSAGAIVVGLGDSEHSAEALALAHLLAGSLGGPLVLVHGQPDDISQKLRQIAEQEDAQLIVIGPSEPSGLGRLRPRSVGEKLLSEGRLPVAIASGGYAEAEHSLSLIASAFDGSPESRRALDWAAHLTTSAAGRLRVISVHAPIPVAGLGFTAQSVNPGLRQDLKREQAAAVAALGGPVETLLRDGSPASVLVEASREADLLVMGSRGHGPLPAALLGGVAHYVVRRAACPLVIHPHRARRPVP